MMWDYHGNYWFIYGFVILAVIAILVANDAGANGRNGILWGLVTLFMPMMGLLIYLIVRSLPPVQAQQYYSTTVTPSPPKQQVIYQPIQQAKPIAQESNPKVQFCTSCGSQNKITAVYCNSCGSEILSE